MSSLHFSPSPETVLVTGATGFIGQQLVRALLQDRHRVIVLTRSPARAATLFRHEVACISSLDDLAPDTQIDTIVNLAGARILGWRWSAARKQVLRRSRIDLTRGIVDWIARAQCKPRRMFSASAIGYYGIQPEADDTPLTEAQPPQEIFMSRLCEEWEQAARQATGYGVHVVRMRFGLVLGQQGAMPMMMLPLRLGLGGPLGRGNQWLSWIHLQDLLRAIAHLWQLDRNGSVATHDAAFNFTAPQAVPQAQFNRIAAQVLHRPYWLPTPAAPLRWLMGEQAALLLEGQRVVPQRLQQSGFVFDYPELRPALEQLL